MDADIDVRPGRRPDEDRDGDMTDRTTTPWRPPPKTPAPETPAADTTQETETAMAESTTPAAETAAAPAAGGVTLTDEQFKTLLASIAPQPAAVESAPAEPVAEAAPVVAAVTETDDQRIARLVAEGIAKALPQAVQEHVEPLAGRPARASSRPSPRRRRRRQAGSPRAGPPSPARVHRRRSGAAPVVPRSSARSSATARRPRADSAPSVLPDRQPRLVPPGSDGHQPRPCAGLRRTPLCRKAFAMSQNELREALTAVGAAPLVNTIIDPMLLEYQRRYAPLVRAIPSRKWDSTVYYFNQRTQRAAAGS
jgi:hypothetical protein